MSLIDPIANQPALAIDHKILLISDLHLGLSYFYDNKARNDLINLEKVKLIRILKKNKVKKLIIAGDLKDSILDMYHTKKDISSFLEDILNYVEKVILIKGNHDSKLEKLLDKGLLNRVEIDGQYILHIEDHKILIVHGHKKHNLPDKTKILISGHYHPEVSIGNSHNIPLKAWVVINAVTETGDKLKWIILPAFSNMVGGFNISSLSQESFVRLAPIRGIRIIEVNRFLLDLTPI